MAAPSEEPLSAHTPPERWGQRGSRVHLPIHWLRRVVAAEEASPGRMTCLDLNQRNERDGCRQGPFEGSGS
jgi:hypothetical protein